MIMETLSANLNSQSKGRHAGELICTLVSNLKNDSTAATATESILAIIMFPMILGFGQGPPSPSTSPKT